MGVRRDLWLDSGEFGEDHPLRACLVRLGHSCVDESAGAALAVSAQCRLPVSEVPWLAVTPAGDEEAAARAFDDGAFGVLRWPSPDRLVSRLIGVLLAKAGAQARLEQTEKMASLGMMVAGIAHEINTPLGAIASMQHTQARAVGKLQAHVPADGPAAPLFRILEDADRTISAATARVTTIVKQLRSYARLDEAELKPSDMHRCLEDTLLLMHHELKHGFTVRRQYGRVPLIACYPGRINQVFMNLLMNAKQASTPPAEIEVSTGADASHVWVAVHDFGRGIAPENLERIFEAGFTTKGDGVGVGLGLAICHQIVQEHHGRIDVESKVGQGTRFTVWLPLNLAELKEASSASFAADPAP